MGRPKKRKQQTTEIKTETAPAQKQIKQEFIDDHVAVQIKTEPLITETSQQQQQQQQQQEDIPSTKNNTATTPTPTTTNAAEDSFLQNLYGDESNNNHNNNTEMSEEDVVVSILDLTSDNSDGANKALSSGYAIHTTSGEYEPIDIYVSDGSESSDEEDTGGGNDEEPNDITIILTNSRLGVMRRGGLGLTLQNMNSNTINKQWIRSVNDAAAQSKDGAHESETKEAPTIDPAILAARELAESKALARRVESAENAGRDPCLFSKRTAFDIRMDQIEDKPWERGDVTDFFNYSMTEFDWAEYAEGQLAVRQELTDASRQKRQPDPNIVPVEPKMPSKQNPKVSVSVSVSVSSAMMIQNDGGATNNVHKDSGSDGIGAVKVIGPTVPMVCTIVPKAKQDAPTNEGDEDDAVL